MAIAYLEGFDDGLYSNRATHSAGCLFGSSYGLDGDGLRCGDTVGGGTAFYVPTGVTPGNEYHFGAAVRPVVTGGGNTVKFGSTDIRLVYTANTWLLYVAGSASPDIYWYSGIVALNEWHYLEVKIKVGTSFDGELSYWVDGVLINSTTGFDYQTMPISTITLGGASSSDIDSCDFDNVYVTNTAGTVNTANLGPIEVQTLLPDGNGNYSQMTGSDGNSTDNYLLVDENPPNDGTDYVGSATEGTIDTYTFGNLTGTPTVKGAVLAMNATKVESAAKYMRGKTRISSTDYNGTSKGLGQTTYALYEEVWDESPATSTAWTYTELNGAEFGVEVRDS